jgi:AcrR family transcriptional regulator
MTAAIVTAARAVMREQGVAALTLNEVARRVGLRVPSLYEYFPSKAALYDTLFRMSIRLYRERLERVWRDHEPGVERLRAWFEARMTFAHEHPELDQLFLGRDKPKFVPSAESMDESRQFLAAARQAMTEVIDAGALAPRLPPTQALDLIFAVMHGLTTLQAANEPDVPPAMGRFGRLVPEAIALFATSWAPEQPQTGERPTPTSASPMADKNGGELRGRSTSPRPQEHM